MRLSSRTERLSERGRLLKCFGEQARGLWRLAPRYEPPLLAAALVERRQGNRAVRDEASDAAKRPQLRRIEREEVSPEVRSGALHRQRRLRGVHVEQDPGLPLAIAVEERVQIDRAARGGPEEQEQGQKAEQTPQQGRQHTPDGPC